MGGVAVLFLVSETLTIDSQSLIIDSESNTKNTEVLFMSQKVVLITGASSGIGKEAAMELKNKGFTVYAAARRIDKMQDLAAKGIRPISLDVTNDESMIQAVNEILKKEGRIDILVNNAGYGSYGAVEDIPMEEARRQMEVNVFGLARLIQLVVPSMRKNKFGKIVNVSSMGGRFGPILAAGIMQPNLQ